MVGIRVTRSILIDSSEIDLSTTRAGGPGGQHVNTTDSAVLLRFDVWGSPNLPEAVKHRLSDLAGARLTKEGILILRSDGNRSQHVNRQDVQERLMGMIREATIVPERRKPTKPTKASQKRRVEGKAKRSAVKSLRGKVRE
ncbi:MAG: aminoacyl-tRNA hydrolase [Sphingomonadales bacterium]|nr:aminoacyl-tRNA hydrolase [Sphingomonadales bacterium]MDE2168730.1 aminoacyl-tRNA hydrolase [Sphingomonadales bacterium]